MQTGNQSQISHCLRVNQGHDLAGSGVVLVPIPSGDALPSGPSTLAKTQAGKKKEERNKVKIEAAEVLFHNNLLVVALVIKNLIMVSWTELSNLLNDSE